MFVPRFYYDRRNTNFLKNLKLVGVNKEIDEKHFNLSSALGRKSYEFQKKDNSVLNYPINDFPFPDKYFPESFGYTLHGFSFIGNGTNDIKQKLNLSSNLINFESNTESEENTLSDETFYPVVKNLKEKIAEYNAVPTKNFINESYLLYNTSNLIKKNICYCH